MAKPVTKDHLRSRKKPNIAKVTIVLDPESAEKYNEARNKAELAKIRLDVRKEDPDLIEAYDAAVATLAEVREEIDEDIMVFEFRALGRKKFEQLMEDHPPSKEQVAEAAKTKDTFGFNPVTFPPKVTFLSMMDNSMLWEEFMEEIWDSDNWSGAETTALYMGALSANSERRDVNLGNV